MDAEQINEEDFDSSDGLEDEYDWDRSIFRANPNVGRLQADDILAKQATDRPLSKKNCRKLTFVTGAPKSQESMARVRVTWEAFCQSVSHDINVTPSGETIFRYVDTMTRRVKSGLIGKHAPSLSVIQGIWYRLIRFLQFHHRDLNDHYGKTEQLRISTHLDQLVKRGLLVKGQWFKKLWLGFLVVKKLATCWIETALADGCLSWDRVLLKLLGNILQSALAARAGDVARSMLYTGCQYLAYEHIELKLESPDMDGPFSVQQLRGRFTLKYRKGKKDMLNDDDVLFVDPISDESHNVVCLVKLLLIVAMRFGNVYGRTVQEVLEDTSKQNDRVIRWKYPKRPVLCRMPRGLNTHFDDPAPISQLNNSLKQIGLAAKVLDHLTSHGVRRGAMRDTAYIKKSIAGVQTACAALVGGHSKTAENRGLTRDYVGALQENIYNIRADTQFKDRLGPNFGTSAFIVHPNTSAEIDEYLESHDIDKNNSSKRAWASWRLRQQQVKDWADTNRNAPYSNKTDDVLAPQPNKASIGKGTTVVRPSARKGPQPHDGSTQVQKNFSTPSTTSKGPEDTQDRDAEYIPINPRLLALDDNNDDVEETAIDALKTVMFYDNPNDDADVDSLPGNSTENAIINEYLREPSKATESNTSPLLSGPDAFVDWFAAANIFKLSTSFKQNDPEEAKKYVASGNSRNLPIPFLFYCGIELCMYSTWNISALDRHQIVCQGKSRAERQFSCNIDNCDGVFLNAQSLRSHEIKMHIWTARTCARCPSIIETLYSSFQDWRKHQDSAHNTFDESSKIHCSLRADSKCNNSEKLYDGYSALIQHLQSVHKISAKEARAMLPSKSTLQRQTQSFNCPITTCTLENKSTCSRDLRNHLKRKHHLSDEEIQAYVPPSTTELARRNGKAAEKPRPLKPAWKCPVADCTSTGSFPANRDRRKHLEGVHKWSADMAVDHVPLSKTEAKSQETTSCNGTAFVVSYTVKADMVIVNPKRRKVS